MLKIRGFRKDKTKGRLNNSYNLPKIMYFQPGFMNLKTMLKIVIIIIDKTLIIIEQIYSNINMYFIFWLYILLL